MANIVPLSALTEAVAAAVHWYFDGQILKIKAEITDVKKYPYKKWCFLKFVEKQQDVIVAEFKGVFWSTGYPSIVVFEQQTGQRFEDGLEVICDVKVTYSSKFGLSLEVLDIDASHTIGSMELERQATIDKLIANHPALIRKDADEYITFNNSTPLPALIQKVALITAPDSDGERDFKTELLRNKYGFHFEVDAYLCTIQGTTAIMQILQQIKKIVDSGIVYNAIVIVRGGGSNTDFKPFDSYELSLAVAKAPIPILTGIGHDRNISIVDCMARPFKTPTKVANFLIEQCLMLDKSLEQIQQRIDYIVDSKLNNYSNQLAYINRFLHQVSLQKSLSRGFALIYKEDVIITQPSELKTKDTIEIILQEKKIIATITKISKHGKQL